MIHWLWLIPAMMLGAAIGFVLCALLTISGMDEIEKERYL